MPKYPDIEVELIGQSGNAFYIIGAVLAALRKARVPEEERKNFRIMAMAGDYDWLLRTVMAYVVVT